MSETPQAPPPAQPPSTSPPAQRDTTMAWLAHLLMIPTFFIGPLVIWLVKKDEDKYVGYHAKQALCWSVVVIMVFFVILVLLWIPFVICLLPFLGGLAWMGHVAYGIVGLVFAAQNKPFKYFFVADQFCKKEFAEAYPDAPAA